MTDIFSRCFKKIAIQLANAELPNAELPNTELLNAELPNVKLLNAESYRTLNY